MTMFTVLSRSIYRRRAFGHAGPSTWSTPSNNVKSSTHSLSIYRCHRKYFHFSFYYSTPNTFEVTYSQSATQITYLLTYLLTETVATLPQQ